MKRDIWIEVRRLNNDGLSARAIAVKLGINRRTVASALRSESQPRRQRGQGRPSIIDGHRGWILGKLEAYPRLSAFRLFVMLTELGYAGQYGAVKEFVRDVRPSARPAVMTLRFAPGEPTWWVG